MYKTMLIFICLITSGLAMHAPSDQVSYLELVVQTAGPLLTKEFQEEPYSFSIRHKFPNKIILTAHQKNFKESNAAKLSELRGKAEKILLTAQSGWGVTGIRIQHKGP